MRDFLALDEPSILDGNSAMALSKIEMSDASERKPSKGKKAGTKKNSAK